MHSCRMTAHRFITTHYLLPLSFSMFTHVIPYPLNIFENNVETMCAYMYVYICGPVSRVPTPHVMGRV